MKKKVLAVALLAGIVMSITGCSQAPAVTDKNKIPYGKDLVIEGAAGVERDADVANSKYYKSLDFYNMKSDENLTIIENFKTIQQATEWTCGLTSIAMVLEHYDALGDKTEADLVELRQNPEPGATTLKQMMNVFDALGGWDMYSTFDLPDHTELSETFIPDTLKEGKPIILGWDDWNGHWQVIIGYDSMGTETTADDVVIVADPYDTTDHNQDGYLVVPFERLIYNWGNEFDPDFDYNLFLVPTPSK